ncbi:MAG: hypothetical protein GY719_40885, partial [bacterium]|nr:hypothetical protein [bacterium]
ADATRFAVNTVTYVIAPSIAMWALWHYQGRGEEHEDIPDWKRDLYTVVPLPGEGNHAMFPKPFEHGVVYGSGTERFLTYLKNQDPDAFEGYYKSLLDAFLPGSDIAITAGTLENAKNRDNYTGRPIIPRPEQKLAASEQYGPYTSETSKLIAAGARKVPGAGKLVGTEESHAIAPRHIDNLIYSWTAGLGQEYAVPALDKAVNLMFKGTELGDDLGIGEKQTGLKRLPVVKTFIG